MRIFLGNAIALVACVIMVVSGYLKSKRRTLVWQTVQIGLSMFSCLILGAYSGMIANAIAVPRNVLAYKGKLNIVAKLIIVIASTVLILLTNSAGWVYYRFCLLCHIHYYWTEQRQCVLNGL